MVFYEALLSAFVGFVTVRLSAPYIISFLKKKGIVRPDAHKPGNPIVAHSGGIIIFLGFTLSTILFLLLIGDIDLKVKFLAVYFSGLMCFLVGLYDDLKILRGIVKMALTVLGILPIIVFYMTFPDIIELGRPVVPFIGQIRITIIYWLLLPFAIAGASNVVNMIDIYNGVVPGMTMVALIGLLGASIVFNSTLGLVFSIIFLGVMLAYFPYNYYPAKVFNGDSGSLFIGALLGAVAVVGKMEFIVLTLLLPHLINGFMILVSFGGFKEHREIKGRPVLVLNNGLLKANDDPNAPWSLTRIVLLIGGPASEKELSLFYIVSEILPSALAVITASLMVMG